VGEPLVDTARKERMYLFSNALRPPSDPGPFYLGARKCRQVSADGIL
jgi:hypothetical protein